MIVLKDKEAKVEYIKDAANYNGNADEVFIPEDLVELHNIMTELYSKGKAITISAARTGLTGGGVPLSGNLISTERLDKILKINKKEKTALLEPGVRLQTFHNDLKQYGLIYPSNPTETWSTIGGNVATNASGAKTFKYGATRNFVNYLEISLHNGDEVHISRGEQFASEYKAELKTINNNIISFDIPQIMKPNTSKNAAGYYLDSNMDLIDLFIGSEGTLGVIKKIGLDLINEPEQVLSSIIFFDAKNNLLNFVDFLREDNDLHLNPRLIEYFDRNSLKLLSKHHSEIPDTSVGAIWVEFETNLELIDEITSNLYRLALKHTDLIDNTWVAISEKERERITQFRHNLPLSVNELLTKYGQQKIYTDTAVPQEHFRYYYNTMYDLLSETELEYVVFGHIGDCHLHANLFVKNEEDKIKAIEFYKKMVSLSIELDGTFSAEHGVGKIKREFLLRMYSEEVIEGMKKIKTAFDPKGLIGQNTLFFDRES